MATVLVTGGNRGIGLELCRQLRERGDEAIAACRKSSPELDALGIRTVTGADVSTDEGTQLLARALDGATLDLLVNNAGIMYADSVDKLDFERVRRQFEVNVLGPLRVTLALLPQLKRGARVAIISSRMGSIADNSSGGYYGYRLSKAAVNMAGVSLARDLRGRGIAVALLHPGMVATELTGGQGIPPDEAAAGLIARMDAISLERSGEFRHANGETLPW